jgi:hypothetical protein
MKLHHHTAVSLSISGILYLIFKSWELSIVSFLSGILIDLDHIFDVVREHGWSIKIADFFRICHKGQFNRIFLLLHGWEWIALLGTASWFSRWNPWITGVFIGFTQHMILDNLHNGTNIWCYSILWRWKKDFDFNTIFPKMAKIKYKFK